MYVKSLFKIFHTNTSGLYPKEHQKAKLSAPSASCLWVACVWCRTTQSVFSPWTPMRSRRLNYRCLSSPFPPFPLLACHLPRVSPLPLFSAPAWTFGSTSDLQTNCMLRSSSTKPLARSWTMPSTTWPPCRRAPPPRRLCFHPTLPSVYHPSIKVCCHFTATCLCLSSASSYLLSVCVHP